MEENRAGTQEKKELYEYVNLPKNVRQIGVPLPGIKIYLEDYVITYLKQSFVNMEEFKIVILLGKKGTEEAENSIFLYGAIALEEEDILENGRIQRETWDHVYEVIHQSFSGVQVYGCACGVSVWNSDMESRIRKLQKEEFATQDRVMFLWDLCEKEEKIFIWQQGMVKEQSGYYIYFEKNPQMQDFMLDKQPKVESIDADYQDKVTDTMRHVIEEKEEDRQRKWQMFSYCGAVLAGVAILFGVHMMMDSTERIRNMEETVDALSEYVGKQREEVETMTRETKNAVQQIPFESQATGLSEGEREKKEKTGEMQAATNDPGRENSEAQAKEKASSENHSAETADNQVEQGSQSDSETKPDISEEMALQAMKKNAHSYIVQKGDTLSQIVWRQYHDFSYEKQVRKINGIKDADKIYEGQCILLPKGK